MDQATLVAVLNQLSEPGAAAMVAVVLWFRLGELVTVAKDLRDYSKATATNTGRQVEIAERAEDRWLIANHSGSVPVNGEHR